MLSINQLLKTLPHLYPFLLIDRVLEITPGQSAVGLKNVTYNEPFFRGHFPDYPIMPGVLILEAMAQLGGLLLKPDQGSLVLLQAFDQVRFHSIVQPGDVLTLEAKFVREIGKFGRVDALSRVEDRKVCTATITYVRMDEINIDEAEV